MPYSKCPVCGAISHLSVGDTAQWYRDRYPDLPVGSLVPGKCFDCWPELTAADRVVIRPSLAGKPQAPAGTRGEIKQVLSAAQDGTVYLVRLASGAEHYFIRAELRKLRGSDAEPQTA